MKVLVLSDLQGIYYYDWIHFLEIDQNEFDCLFLLGDIDLMYVQTIVNRFRGKPIFGVHGNHDYAGDLEHAGVQNIHNRTVEVMGYTLVGMEGCVRYKVEDAPMFTQNEATLICMNLPKADIVIAHNSPKGIHDKEDHAHIGFEGLRLYVERKKPKYLLHGHQHTDKETLVGNTKVIGVYGGIILDTEAGTKQRVLNVCE